MIDCIALVVAAGTGERFGGTVPKQYRAVNGAPMARRTVQAFLAHPKVDGVLVVINGQHRSHYDQALGDLPLLPPVAGGASRQESVCRGLEALAADPPQRVLIHDAARPFVDAATIDRVIDALETDAAAIAAIPVTDTLKREVDGHIDGTIDRAGLWRAQTPQGFRFAPILEAHRQATGLALTDDAAVAERSGIRVRLVPGSRSNVKVTTPEDMPHDDTPTPGPPMQVRVGTGYDVHRFVPGDAVILCGITIPFTARLAGHSDADVGLHVVTDAILGALADGDIGSHFPPTDPQWKGADSAVFLRHAVDLVTARGGRIGHVDVTLICERPKIGPHRPEMRRRLAELLGIDPGSVSVKSTTTERLGFTGRGEGIAAQAAATLYLP